MPACTLIASFCEFVDGAARPARGLWCAFQIGFELPPFDFLVDLDLEILLSRVDDAEVVFCISGLFISG